MLYNMSAVEESGSPYPVVSKSKYVTYDSKACVLIYRLPI